MGGYTNLTRERRYQIQALLKADQNQTKIATVPEVDKTTISREIRRNRGHRGYRPQQAQLSGASSPSDVLVSPKLCGSRSTRCSDRPGVPNRSARAYSRNRARRSGLSGSTSISMRINGRVGICTAHCAARRSDGNAMARIGDGDGSRIMSRSMSDGR